MHIVLLEKLHYFICYQASEIVKDGKGWVVFLVDDVCSHTVSVREGDFEEIAFHIFFMDQCLVDWVTCQSNGNWYNVGDIVVFFLGRLAG